MWPEGALIMVRNVARRRCLRFMLTRGVRGLRDLLDVAFVIERDRPLQYY